MKSVENAETDDLRINLLTQEIKFAKLLAANVFDGVIKEKHIEKLGIWLKDRVACTEEFTDKNCMRIWKGLFYGMWMSDKPLPQENLANKIAALLHIFGKVELSLQFYAAFLKTMALEWNGIDQWRIDKFMMLVRRVTREIIRVIKQNNWSREDIDELNETLKKTVLGTDYVPRGLFMHFTELYFEEVAKVSTGEIPAESVTQLLEPFMYYVASQSDYKLIQFVVRHVFNHLLFQSECGRNYKEKFDAWKSMNFPGKSIDEMVLEEPAEEDSNEDEVNDDASDAHKEDSQVLDPRAGRVDVLMSEIKFDPREIVDKLGDLMYKKFTRVHNRKCLNRIVSTYTKFADGVFPIGIQRIKIDREETKLPDIDEKAAELLQFDNELYGEQRKLKQLNKRKRKKILSDPNLFEDFQAKSNKVAKIKHEANTWTEEDMTKDKPAEQPVEKKQEKKKKLKKTDLKQSKNDKLDQPNSKMQKKSEWEKPLEDGEVEYFIPSIKQQLNGVSKVTTTKDSVTEDKIDQSPENQSKVSSISVTALDNGPPKSPKTKKSKSESETLNSSKKNRLQNNSPKTPSDIKKVNSTSKLTQSKTTTPHILTGSETPLSEKRVKIALKMNKSQEVTEYIRQLKQSPHLPYDSAKKPSKGVLKPNLAPSPINPFYKKLIGIQ